jgi:hypothetical protein
MIEAPITGLDDRDLVPEFETEERILAASVPDTSKGTVAVTENELVSGPIAKMEIALEQMTFVGTQAAPDVASRIDALKVQIIVGWRRNRESLTPLFWELKILLRRQGARDGNSFEGFLTAHGIPLPTINRWLKIYRQELEVKSSGDNAPTSAQMSGSGDAEISTNTGTTITILKADPKKVAEFKGRNYTTSVRIEIPANGKDEFWAAAKAITPFLDARNEHEAIYAAVMHVFHLFKDHEKRA